MAKRKLNVIEDIPHDKEISDGALFRILSNDVSYLTHNIHKYPAKFIPHVPRWAIKKYLGSENQWVLDPFCGSGTTLVEGAISGHNVIGIDIDPLSCLITKVKTTPIPRKKLVKSKKELIEAIKKKSDVSFKPPIRNLGHWFMPEQIEALGRIRECIENFREDRDLYDFFMITFSSIIRKASNADDQSQKTYVSHTFQKSPKPAGPLFLKNLDIYSSRILEFGKIVKGHNNKRIVCTADSRNLKEVTKAHNIEKVDIAITSPPYIKALDYIYTQMVEYFWIGDLWGLETQEKQNRYKVNYIGTKQVPVEIYKSVPKTNVAEIDALVSKIKKKDVKHAYITAKFFTDMRANLENVYDLLQTNGHYIVVIGNNRVSGYCVPSHLFLMKCAERVGFEVTNYFRYEIRNRYMRFPRNGRGGIIKHDWVLDLEKSS